MKRRRKKAAKIASAGATASRRKWRKENKALKKNEMAININGIENHEMINNALK